VSNRVYSKPTDERAFLESLQSSGVDVHTEAEPYELYDRVTLCYYSKALEEPVEVPCYVMGRRLAHGSKLPRGIKVKVLEVHRVMIRLLLAEV
jgi:hypothetical protein